VIADRKALPEPQEEPAPALDGAMKRSTPPPRNWWRLTGGKRQGRDPARDALKAMVPWVDWLVGRYGLAHVVPPCWWAHGAMVEELSALQAAWLGAYENPDAPADAGVVWHEHLQRCLGRLREWNVARCAAGHHRPAAESTWKTNLSWPRRPSQSADRPQTQGSGQQAARARAAK
jgi:hypothetical protein